MTDIVDGEEPTGEAGSRQVVFNQERAERIQTRIPHKSLFGLLIKNKILTFLTLSIYRFWAKTNLRRMLWNSFSIDGDRFEYHGTAKELFIGFLIVLALLIPYFIVVEILGMVISVENATASTALAVINGLALFSLWQFARYRLWRYRLSRTTWRGVRFFLTGKAMTYLGITLLWSLAWLVTLGWAYPWLKAAQLKYQLGNSCFGDQKFDFQGTAKEIFRIYWLPNLIRQIALVPFVVILFFINFDDLLVGELVINRGAPAINVGVYVLAILAIIACFLYYKAVEIRYITSRLVFGAATFSSHLSAGSLFRIAFVAILACVILIAALGLIVAGIAMLTSSGGSIGVWQIGLLAFILIFLLFLDIFKVYLIVLPIAKSICKTTTISGFETFEDVAQNAEISPKYGEGLADALDVGAF